MKKEPLTEQEILAFEQAATQFATQLKALDNKAAGPHAERYAKAILVVHRALRS